MIFLNPNLEDYLIKLGFWLFLILFYIGFLELVQYISHKRGTPKLIISDFNIPDQLSPAAVRYLLHLKYDHKSLMISILQVYIKQHITIIYENEKCILRRINKQNTIATSEEKLLLKMLFGKKRQKLILDRTNGINLDHLLKKLVRVQFYELKEQKYFLTNIVLIFFIALLSFFLYLFSVFTIVPPPMVSFSILAGISTFLLLLFFWFQHIKSLIGISIFGLLLFIFVAFSSAPMENISWWHVLYVLPIWITFVIVTWKYSKKLKIHSKKGVMAKKRLLGLHEYIKTAELSRYESLNPHSTSIETKEALFPYAVAFGLETNFTKKLEANLKKMM